MHIEPVEIYADTTNAAVMRHPGRKFPGVLLQGDTLYSMCRVADSVCALSRPKLDAEAFDQLNGLRTALQSLLTHYKAVLEEHDVAVPFDECT